MKVAIYARVSTRKKKEQNGVIDFVQDTENQLRQLRDFCERQQWEVFREYVDRKTAKDADREEFITLFEDASQHQFDMVLFWSLDRFSREGVFETLQHLARLTSYNVGYRSYTEQYLDSCGLFKDAVISILATIARQERVRLSERVLAGLERTKAKGTKLGRPRVTVDSGLLKKMREQGATWEAIKITTGVSKGTAQRACAERSA